MFCTGKHALEPIVLYKITPSDHAATGALSARPVEAPSLNGEWFRLPRSLQGLDHGRVSHGARVSSDPPVSCSTGSPAICDGARDAAIAHRGGLGKAIASPGVQQSDRVSGSCRQKGPVPGCLGDGAPSQRSGCTEGNRYAGRHAHAGMRGHKVRISAPVPRITKIPRMRPRCGGNQTNNQQTNKMPRNRVGRGASGQPRK